MTDQYQAFTQSPIGKFVVKHRILIVIASILLCIPSLFGYINTDINYDILVYLPEDIDTMKGQDILAEDFDMGSFAMCVVENMSSKDVLDLEEKYKDIEAWKENPILQEEAFDKLQLIMTEAGELEQKAPYDKIVNNTFAEKVTK
mgnify:CR=1 FL=1